MAEIGECDQLEIYKSQLKQIRDALVIATEEQKPDLIQIESDLLEIIEILQQPTSSSAADDSSDETSQNIIKLEDELQSLEGVKCKVLFRYEWGGFGYHNAIILGSELSEDSSSICVNVVFMHPTSKQMMPCPYYLDGTCKYSDERCHFSHGYSVKLDEIQDYKEPDYSKITEGSVVLAKYKDGLWYRGNVENIIEDAEFSVKFPHCNEALLLNFHSIYPLDEEEEDNPTHFSAEENDDLDLNSRHEVQLFLADKSSFGQWEKHTKGIGSKLMTKMGYVHGTGLGKEGEGRTEPVEAMVFPPGRSLDRCMELREKAGSEDMLTVERRLERQKAQNEHRLRQLAKAPEKSVSVFDFINSKLTKTAHQESKGVADGALQSQSKKGYLSHISKEKLNVQSLQIGEEIRRAERDVTRLKQSIQRQSDRGDLTSVSQIRSRLADKERELDSLRASDRTISNEQKQRKSSSKLTIF